jgi:nitric oxide reductase subunit B
MKYASQIVARNFFVAAVLLFGVQVLVGLAASIKFIWPEALVLPFNTFRSLHINALVVWLLLGLMGATYYVIPEESETELWSLPLAKLQFWATIGVVLLVVVGYVIQGLYPEANKIVLGTHLLSEGREYIEAPRWADFLIVLSVLAFLLNCYMTVLKTRKWTSIQGVLLFGLTGLALMYLPGMVYTRSMVKDQYWWWWVIHLWVEGTWEVIAGALLCFMLVKLTGVSRETLEKWMYIEVGLVLFTGILGTGHHYYWIGTPRYWLWIGGFFSALEPIPLLLMTWDAFKFSRQTRAVVTNRLGMFLAVSHALFNFIGAGLWGIIHTLPIINKWTHGTQITTAHGHLAFYGAYVLLIVAIMYIALPELAGRPESYDQRRGFMAFWWMTISMIFVVVILTGAGMVQVYMERVIGLDYVAVKSSYNLWFWIFRSIFGAGFAVGTGLLIWDVLSLSREAKEPIPDLVPVRP